MCDANVGQLALMDKTVIKQVPRCTSNRQQPAPGEQVGIRIGSNFRRVYIFLTLLQPNSSQAKLTVSEDMKHHRIVLTFDPNCNVSVTFQMKSRSRKPLKKKKKINMNFQPMAPLYASHMTRHKPRGRS